MSPAERKAKQQMEQRIRTSPVNVTTHAMLRYHQRYDRRAPMSVIEERLHRRVRAAEDVKPAKVLHKGFRVTAGDLTLAVKEDEGTLVVVSVWGRRKWA